MLNNTKSELLTVLICLGGICTLFGLTASSHRPLCFDEPAYLAPITLLDQRGLSLEFIREYPEPAGLLHNVVHWLLRPLTHLQPPAVRLVNPVLLLMTVGCIALSLRIIGSPFPFGTSLTLIAIPFMWVLSGMVLTEMPAIFLSSLSICCLLLATHIQADRPMPASLIAFMGGLSLGLAFTSRAPTIVIVFATPLLLLGDFLRFLPTVITFGFAAMILPVALCAYWGGLVPPHSVVAVNPATFSYYNTVLSISYASVVMLILAPQWFSSVRSPILIMFVAGLVFFNAVFGFVEINAAGSAIKALPTFLIGVWPRAVGSGLLGLAIIFAASALRDLYQQRTNATALFLSVAMLLLVVSTGKITHQFSSRYTGLASPVMVLVSDRYSPPSAAKPLRLAIGMVIGLICLLSYYAAA